MWFKHVDLTGNEHWGWICASCVAMEWREFKLQYRCADSLEIVDADCKQCAAQCLTWVARQYRLDPERLSLW